MVYPEAVAQLVVDPCQTGGCYNDEACIGGGRQDVGHHVLGAQAAHQHERQYLDQLQPEAQARAEDHPEG